MQKNVLTLYISKIAAGDRSFVPKLCARLADRLIYVPLVSDEGAGKGKGKQPQSTKVNVLKLADGDRSVVPIFTSERKLKQWGTKRNMKLEILTLLGCDFCAVLDPNAWLSIDPDSDPSIDLSPDEVDLITQDLFIEAFQAEKATSVGHSSAEEEQENESLHQEAAAQDYGDTPAAEQPYEISDVTPFEDQQEQVEAAPEYEAAPLESGAEETASGHTAEVAEVQDHEDERPRDDGWDSPWDRPGMRATRPHADLGSPVQPQGEQPLAEDSADAPEASWESEDPAGELEIAPRIQKQPMPEPIQESGSDDVTSTQEFSRPARTGNAKKKGAPMPVAEEPSREEEASSTHEFSRPKNIPKAGAKRPAAQSTSPEPAPAERNGTGPATHAERAGGETQGGDSSSTHEFSKPGLTAAAPERPQPSAAPRQQVNLLEPNHSEKVYVSQDPRAIRGVKRGMFGEVSESSDSKPKPASEKAEGKKKSLFDFLKRS